MLFSSCTTKISHLEKGQQFIESQFPDEISFIQKMDHSDFKAELQRLLANVHSTSISDENCSVGQIACSFSSYPHTIFFKPKYFRLSKEEQFTTILHESFHLFHNNFDHVLCTKEKSWGHECDEDLNSAYGIEYKYLLYKYHANPSENILSILKRLDRRVNKS